MTRRLPVYFLVEVSSYTSTDVLTATVRGIKHFWETAKANPFVSETIDLRLITFDTALQNGFELSFEASLQHLALGMTKNPGNVDRALSMLSEVVDHEFVRQTFHSKGDWLPIVLVFSQLLPRIDDLGYLTRLDFHRAQNWHFVQFDDKSRLQRGSDYSRYFQIITRNGLETMPGLLQWKSSRDLIGQERKQIELRKVRQIDLTKKQRDVPHDFLFELSWESKYERDFQVTFAKINPCELEMYAFLLDSRDKITDFGSEVVQKNGQKFGLYRSDVVFIHNRRPIKAVSLITDKHRGFWSTEHREKIFIDSQKIPKKYNKIVISVAIHNGSSRNQDFSKIQNGCVRLLKSDRSEIASSALSSDQVLKGRRSMIWGELVRMGANWGFRKIELSYSSDSFVEILKQYI